MNECKPINILTVKTYASSTCGQVDVEGIGKLEVVSKPSFGLNIKAGGRFKPED
jgi:hypothetical protein